VTVILPAILVVLSCADAVAQGVDILGTHYSSKLRALLITTEARTGKKVQFVPISGHVDNVMEATGVMRLKPGSTEDVVAHELMHAMLRTEHYPELFHVVADHNFSPFFEAVMSDLDHLFINQRLNDIGYDPQNGFLRRADPYMNTLTFRLQASADYNTSLSIYILHELLKYKHYVGNSSAESPLLRAFPFISPYWRDLDASIVRLPKSPHPLDMWDFGKHYIHLMDEIAMSFGRRSHLRAYLSVWSQHSFPSGVVSLATQPFLRRMTTRALGIVSCCKSL
jgi:hypothetical protein